MAEARYQDVRRDKDLIPYVIEAMPQREFGDVQFDGELVFGNGEDGDVTISADTSLAEDMYYNNLTLYQNHSNHYLQYLHLIKYID